MQIDDYHLNDEVSFSICPDLGCNLFSWKINGREKLYCPESVFTNPEEFYHGGNPILFPSVGRTWDRSGKKPISEQYNVYGLNGTYRMPDHGILRFCKWHKISEEKTSKKIRVAYECIIPEEVRQRNYPFGIKFSQIFIVSDDSITLEANFENVGTTPTPLAFGYHPYFSISNAKREGIELHIPFRYRLPLDPELVLPTGQKIPAKPVMNLESNLSYDLVFAKPFGQSASLVDRKANRVINVDFDKNIEMLVIYARQNEPFVCLEPWTRGLGAYETLKHKNWQEGNDIMVLKPKEKKKISIVYSAMEV